MLEVILLYMTELFIRTFRLDETHPVCLILQQSISLRQPQHIFVTENQQLHAKTHIFAATYITIIYVITGRLAFPTQSLCMRPNFQGLPWLSFMGVVKQTVHMIFAEFVVWKICRYFYFYSLGTKFLYISYFIL
jgi:hypothetical protein